MPSANVFGMFEAAKARKINASMVSRDSINLINNGHPRDRESKWLLDVFALIKSADEKLKTSKPCISDKSAKKSDKPGPGNNDDGPESDEETEETGPETASKGSDAQGNEEAPVSGRTGKELWKIAQDKVGDLKQQAASGGPVSKKVHWKNA